MHLTRRLPDIAGRPLTVNEERRSVTATLTTGAPVRRSGPLPIGREPVAWLKIARERWQREGEPPEGEVFDAVVAALDRVLAAASPVPTGVVVPFRQAEGRR